MHLAFAETTTGTPKVYWNLDGAVGVGGLNKFDDVMFVQWCFYKMGKQNWRVIMSLPRGAEVAAVLARTNINGTCTGQKNDDLVEKITLVEAALLGTMDGRVTPMKKTAMYSDHWGFKHVYLIMMMNFALAQLYPEQYPRIDQVPEFIWRIKDQVVYPFDFGK